MSEDGNAPSSEPSSGEEHEIVPDPAHRLIELRLNAGMSQRQLADAIGVTQEVIKYAESGRGRPHPHNQKLIADHFGLRVTDLFPPGNQ